MDNIFDCVIIGSGPAGMSAGIYASRAGIKTAIVEFDAPGGKLVKTHKVENYPSVKSSSGVDLALKMFDHVQNSEIEFISGQVLNVAKNADIFNLDLGNSNVLAKTVIVASGTRERKLGLAHEDEYIGKGVSFCAVCDGSLYKNETVVVIGGGNSALEESLYLAKFCQKVIIVLRRDQFRAEKNIVDLVLKTKNIDIIYNSLPKSLIIKDHKVKGLVIENKFNQQKTELEAACIFPYIGADPVTDFIKSFGVLDENGFILVNQNMETQIAGLFGAGDVIKKNLRQIVTATSDGAIAALSASAYLKGVSNV